MPASPRRLEILSAAALCFACSCSGERPPWELAKSENTVQAYREFIRLYPNDPNVAEAMQRKGELEFIALGETPSSASLRDFLERYGDSPYAELVKLKVDEAVVWELLYPPNLPGLRSFAAAPDRDPAFKERAQEAVEFVAAASHAIRRLDDTPFVRYLKDHAGGEFSDDARDLFAWMQGLHGQRQKKTQVAIDGDIAAELYEVVERRFTALGVVVERSESVAADRVEEGEIAYRFLQLVPGKRFKIRGTEKGTIEVEIQFYGLAVEILTKHRGRLRPIWGRTLVTGVAGGDRRSALDPEILTSIEFPILTWPSSRAELGKVVVPGGMAEMARIGQDLVVTNLDGLTFLDVTLPYRPRVKTQYVHKSTSGKETGDVQSKIAVSPKGLIARYGEGLDLVRVDGDQFISNDRASFFITGRIAAGVFAGERFYFSSDNGTSWMALDSPQATWVSKDKLQHMAVLGRTLIGTNASGVHILQLDPSGAISARKLIGAEQFPEDFSASTPIVGSAQDGPDLLLLNQRGAIGRLVRQSKVTAEGIDTTLTGKTMLLGVQGVNAILLGPAGISALRRSPRGYDLVDSMAFHGCTDIELDHPIAYLACGDVLSVVHTGALMDHGKMK